MPQRFLLTVAQILNWADAHHAVTGEWPTERSGPVHGADGLTWYAASQALRNGGRGLPGGASLASLLARERGVQRMPGRGTRPLLTQDRILHWAELHRTRTGRWPTAASGPVAEAPGEVWTTINQALRDGRRGLPGGSSLSQLLAGLRRAEYTVPAGGPYRQATGLEPANRGASLLREEAPNGDYIVGYEVDDVPCLFLQDGGAFRTTREGAHRFSNPHECAAFMEGFGIDRGFILTYTVYRLSSTGKLRRLGPVPV
jgi:hypothetical protein